MNELQVVDDPGVGCVAWAWALAWVGIGLRNSNSNSQPCIVYFC